MRDLSDDTTYAGPSKRKNRNQERRAIEQRLADRRQKREERVKRPEPLGLWSRMWLDSLDDEIAKLEARLEELAEERLEEEAS